MATRCGLISSCVAVGAAVQTCIELPTSSDSSSLREEQVSLNTTPCFLQQFPQCTFASQDIQHNVV